jgi:copper chaperone CopZ
MNLVGNAIRFTEHGGVTLTIEDGARTLTVAVTDTGGRVLMTNAPFTALQVAVSKSERVLTPLGSFCVKLHVDGMMCGHCTAKVEQALQAVVGVVSVKVDLKAELATVVGTATSAVLIHAIETTGHAAKVVEPDKAPASPRAETQRIFWRTWKASRIGMLWMEITP